MSKKLLIIDKLYDSNDVSMFLRYYSNSLPLSFECNLHSSVNHYLSVSHINKTNIGMRVEFPLTN